MKMNRVPGRAGGVAMLLCAGVFPAAPGYAQVDMELMTYWMDATVIHWSVVGDYDGEDLILNVSTSGYASVKDHVEIGFDYSSDGNGGLVGTPTLSNSSTQMGALRNGADGCRAPTVTGKYEHSTIETLEDGFGGQLIMTVRTDYPAGAVAVYCTGDDQASPARSSTDQQEFFVPAIALLFMGDQDAGGEMQVTKDKKSIIFKRDGWTYTYTPAKIK